ncbi:M4 family metallopeptidase [Nocardioides currus]|uniref:Neutral metalloproteinase n=1 Tax=Nocardioides currus TaxID=2133958 RepID=A0A2R7YYU1_9ACTN|nr:M4 family metallopeptidase [Nocardioides currus]PUA81545.1 peptidase M4 [Nocardioides currus]
MDTSRAHCTFIPPYLLERVGAADALVLDEQLRLRRNARAAEPRTTRAAAVDEPAWTVHDADNTTTLPGRAVRSAGSEPSGDEGVDEAAAGIEGTLAMFADGFSRDSYDGAGAPVSITVHYGQRYDNAFWDGEQLVFGDGDGEVFERFTKAADVLAHEFGHAVTEHTAGLVYEGQSGALNESVSDVFAACFKQHLAGESAADGDWLIGEGIFVAGIQARALRDMAAPGTAYDDPKLGTDPQVGHMDDYVETAEDNGGVHLNSGIPNRAFQLAATAIGGTSLEGAGQVWYAALTSGDVASTADFAAFAAATVAAAGEHAAAVTAAWEQVGVTGAASSIPQPGPVPVGTAGVVRVKRSGGFAGRTEEGIVTLSDADDGVRSLVERVDLDAAAAGAAAYKQMPDMYVFTFQIDDGDPVTLPEQVVTGDLGELATLVLRNQA